MAEDDKDPYAVRALRGYKAKRAHRREFFEAQPEFLNQTTGIHTTTGGQTTVGAQETMLVMGTQNDFYRKSDGALHDVTHEHYQKVLQSAKVTKSSNNERTRKQAHREKEFKEYQKLCKDYGHEYLEILNNSTDIDKSNLFPPRPKQHGHKDNFDKKRMYDLIALSK
ncbi:unnamed protein product [Caenorhabditis auriculariae]|uniref:Uncharacterized protein n=1 Tax=Caenorhabditis auriculariae TaxID=2777116 RepID=A0A8S1HAF2_9PELO|nr:unnamed protein product [Caenorhabditis auriculariae]